MRISHISKHIRHIKLNDLALSAESTTLYACRWVHGKLLFGHETDAREVLEDGVLEVDGSPGFQKFLFTEVDQLELKEFGQDLSGGRRYGDLSPADADCMLHLVHACGAALAQVEMTILPGFIMPI